mmetsp:Transcript_39519/g.53681  ORF Transcript_39519/g.53681 Transcript_39519/m.53681 type:complete len:239 (+) Transcript_39519:2176-2892(+)
MLGRVAHGEEVLEETHEAWHKAGELLRAGFCVELHHLYHELDAGNEHSMGPLLEKRHDLVSKLLDHFWDAFEDADHDQSCLLLQVRVSPAENSVSVRDEDAAHVRIREVTDSGEGEPYNVLALMRQVILDRVGDEREHFGPLVEQQHECEVADPLLREVWGGDKLQTLHLAEVRGVAEHMNEQKFRDITVSKLDIIFLERRADERTFLRNNGPLLLRCLASSDRSDQLPELDRHETGH